MSFHHYMIIKRLRLVSTNVILYRFNSIPGEDPDRADPDKTFDQIRQVEENEENESQSG